MQKPSHHGPLVRPPILAIITIVMQSPKTPSPPSHPKSAINPRLINPLAAARAGHKVVPASTSVRDHTSQRAVGVEDDAVRPGAAARVDLVRAQDGELLVGAGDVEVDVLVVVLRVRVVVAADLRAGLVVLVALGDGGVDVRLPVADAAAGVGARLAGLGREGEGEGEEGEEGELCGSRSASLSFCLYVLDGEGWIGTRLGWQVAA